MKKIIILIPVYNDWESLNKLLNEINSSLESLKNFEFSCVIINDCSSVKQTIISKPSNIKTINIINMRENRGHARCNALGIRHINKNKKFDYVILMDGDGEDRPIEIIDLVNEVINEPEYSVVAKRIKRSEGFFFQLLYQIHKIITFIFTGKNINFGNYSCLAKKDIEKLHLDASLWSSYSGTVKKNLKKFGEINSIRGLRYFGPSQMSIFKLLIHSFSIIAVFKYQVFLRSTFLIIILAYLNLYFGNVSIFLQILIVLFNLIIFIVSLREKENELLNSHNNLDSTKNITHQ